MISIWRSLFVYYLIRMRGEGFGVSLNGKILVYWMGSQTEVPNTNIEIEFLDTNGTWAVDG